MKKLSLFAISWPIFIELTLHMLMGNADTFMLSQYSDDAVAAVGVSNQILSVMIVMFGFIATGTSVLVAQFLGAKQEKQASQIAVVSIISNLVLGLIIGILLLFFSQSLLQLIGVSPSILSEATIYLQIVGLSLLAQSGIMTIGATLRSYRFTKDVMFVTIGMNILNVIGNYLFIFGPFGIPVLGVQGVALSTALSRTIGIIVMFLVLYKRVNGKLPFSNVFKRFPSFELKKILKIGIPSAGEHLSFNGSQLVITSFIVLLGTEALTTRVYAQNIGMFVLLFSIAIGQGTQIIIGHQIGAKQLDEAYKRCITSLQVAIGLATFVGFILFLSSEPIFQIFTENKDIVKTGSLLLLLTVLVEPGRAFNAVVINALRAAGDVNFPVMIGMISMWGVSVPIAYVLGIHLSYGLIGIWIAFIIDEWLRGILMLWRWRQGKWREMAFVQQKKSHVS
ncbi:MATE family efflux transporter [Alkalihalobacillus sp. LMS39]|uniref:MATE family efflux transporter n=1 Tax=Alkalihalobacillus sp. LMS39 TaxID=2924032 RepID=UPI001FB52B38|nr:MATE family efflux transporter [Alkalihalobacillus sp. LMS39]UOE96494.1 MATE family efflux transporter [Alkalihalobacillus sp. LMS39]